MINLAEKKFRSILLQYISEELYMELFKLIELDVDNNTKGFELKNLLTKYIGKDKFTSLGSGTNRFGILIDGYAVKFALDSDGMIDNRREFLYSQDLYPYVVKVYEAFPNGLVAVTEYVEIFNIEAFYKYENKMKEILSDIANNYLVGDVGVTGKNYVNWGIRHSGIDDDICILDFAYIYNVKFNVSRCSCGHFLQYDDKYVNFECPSCGKKYTFGEVRRKISRKDQENEIGDIRRLGYVLTSAEETKEINPEFTHDNSKKKKKTLSETDMYIKAYKKQKKLRKEMEDDDDDFGTVKIEN